MNRPPGLEKESAQIRRIFQELVHDGPARINALEGYRGDHEARITDTEADKLQTASYTERFDDITPDAADENTWVVTDLSGYGVAEGDVCQVLFQFITGSNLDGGVREVGSSLARKLTQNYQDICSWNVTADATGQIEIFDEDVSGQKVYLIGYWRFGTS